MFLNFLGGKKLPNEREQYQEKYIFYATDIIVTFDSKYDFLNKT